MGNLVKVLIIEDSEDDYLLVTRELNKSSYAIKSMRVEDSESLQNAIKNHDWDVFISDNSLPQLNAPRALQIVRQKSRAPFLIVSGTISEADAVTAMKLGASDYIFKGNLGRLMPAFKRALQELENIRKREKAESALLKSEEQFKTLSDSIGDVFFALDAKMNCLYWNKEAENNFGISSEDALGRHFDELFAVLPGQGKKAILETIETSIRTTATFEVDSDSAHFEMICYPFNGGVSVIMKDITDIKKTAIELHKANTELETFMYRLSHDLKGPLVSMIGLIELAKRDISGKVADQYCDMMASSANTLKYVLESLMDVTKIKTGEIHPEEISLQELTEKIIARFEFSIKTIGAQIVTPEEDLIISSDPIYITSILHNLLENALKYGGRRDQKPLIHLAWSIEQGQVRISVKDNGTGIAKEYQSKIFDMFYRASETKSGTGLGLYIVKSASSALGGEAVVENSDSNGSTFTVTFDQSKV